MGAYPTIARPVMVRSSARVCNNRGRHPASGEEHGNGRRETVAAHRYGLEEAGAGGEEAAGGAGGGAEGVGAGGADGGGADDFGARGGGGSAGGRTCGGAAGGTWCAAGGAGTARGEPGEPRAVAGDADPVLHRRHRDA